ncbi:MAG: hypothetical protein ACOYXC_20110 [Candidatus Rifleibacteriota bacterium]
MKKLLLISSLLLSGLPASAIDLREVEIFDTAQEIEFKKNKFLAISEKDLTHYEGVVRQIDRDLAASLAPAADMLELRKNFNSFAARRLNMIRKIFAVFRNEFERIVSFIEPLPADRLPAFVELLKELDDSLDEAKMKGCKEKWHDLKLRSSTLLKQAQDNAILQKYNDGLVLNADDSKSKYLEAKIRLLHRWLLEGMLSETTPWVQQVSAKYPDNPFCLALQAHYWFEDYKLNIADINFKEQLEKKISDDLANKFGSGISISITLKGEKNLQKAYLFYLEALQKGYPADQEIPGLLPAYWQYIEVMYKKVHPYWRYPSHLTNMRDLLKDLSARCRSVVENVPFKKYCRPAFEILNDVYKYWPEDKLGPKIIDYREIMNLSKITSQKKL